MRSSIWHSRTVDSCAQTEERILAAYREFESALERLDYQAYLALLSSDHETIHADERRVTRLELEKAAFPFDGLRECRSEHTLLRIRPANSGLAVLAERESGMTLGNRSFDEELLLQDFWKTEGGEWKLRRRIILRQARKAVGHFSLVEHPLYCQFGDCRTEKSTWKEPSRGE